MPLLIVKERNVYQLTSANQWPAVRIITPVAPKRRDFIRVDKPIVAHQIKNPGLIMLKKNPPITRLLLNPESDLSVESLSLPAFKIRSIPIITKEKLPIIVVVRINSEELRNLWSPSNMPAIKKNSSIIWPKIIFNPANLLVFKAAEIVNMVKGPGIIAPLNPIDTPVKKRKSKSISYLRWSRIVFLMRTEGSRCSFSAAFRTLSHWSGVSLTLIVFVNFTVFLGRPLFFIIL